MCEIGDMALLTELRIRNVTRLFCQRSSVGKILDKSRPPERRWRYPKPTRIVTFGGPTSVGKILDKSRPPEHRWRYPKPQLFSEVSIACLACVIILRSYRIVKTKKARKFWCPSSYHSGFTCGRTRSTGKIPIDGEAGYG